MKIKLVIFDVNQTMFSLSEIERLFQINKLRKGLVDVWFNSVLKEGFFKDCHFKLDSFNVEFHTNIYENYNAQYFAAYTEPGKGDMDYNCEIGDFKIHGRSNGTTVKCKSSGLNSIDENGFALIRARLK